MPDPRTLASRSAWSVPTAADRVLRVHRAHADGVDQLEALAPGGFTRFVQCAPGRLRASLFLLGARDIEVHGGRANLPLRATHGAPPDKVCVTLVLACPGTCVVGARAVSPGTALAWQPGEPSRWVMPAGLRWVTIAAPALLFADVAPAPGGFGPHPRELPIPPRIRSEIRGLLREVDAWGEDGTQAAGIEIEDRSAAGWARVLAWALAGARQPPAAGTGAQRAALAVASAEDFFLERLASTVYLRDVSAAVGVPARTLEAAFRRVLGVTPMGYLEILRAHAVLRALRSPDPLAPCSVHAAERSAGVTHGPRFAARFRALFGEGPAATLAATRQVEAPSDAQVPATP